MLVDLHVHTNRYSDCGRSSPEEMLQRAIEIGLDGLVLTEHNVLWPADEFSDLQARFPSLRLFRGVEMTVKGGDHLLVYGVSDPAALVEGMEPCHLMRAVRRLGGAVILAHPYRYGPDLPRGLEECPVDGIEICSKNILNYAHVQAVALCERLGVPAVVASDGHHVDSVGVYSVRFAGNGLTDGRGLAGAIRRAEYTLHCDEPRLAAWNGVLPGIIGQVRQWIDEGLDEHAIHARLSTTTYTLIRGVRSGLDVGHPTCGADGHGSEQHS